MKVSVLLVLLLLTPAACSGSDEAAPAAPASETPSPPEPTPCTAAEVRVLMVRFVRAFNEGDSETLGKLFAREPYFRWYETPAPGRRVNDAGFRVTLIAYFEKRHEVGERLRLRTFKFGGNHTGGAGGLSYRMGGAGDLSPFGTVEVKLVRRADDLRPTEYVGKGASYCYADEADEIFVWSMGRAV